MLFPLKFICVEICTPQNLNIFVPNHPFSPPPPLVNPQLTEVKETAPPSTLDLSHHQHEEELRAEVEKKSRMLLEVKGHLKQLAEREREREGQQSLVAKERDALREQVKMVSSY